MLRLPSSLMVLVVCYIIWMLSSARLIDPPPRTVRMDPHPFSQANTNQDPAALRPPATLSIDLLAFQAQSGRAKPALRFCWFQL